MSKLRRHDHEELRAVVVEILKGNNAPSSFGNLPDRVEQLLTKMEHQEVKEPERCALSLCYHDEELLREIFWDLFREGVVTLGSSKSSPEFPFFAVTERGRRILDSSHPYFFHDVGSYRKVVCEQLRSPNDVTLLYLMEAMQAYKAGCVLSATVMIGVATEHEFGLLLETIEGNGHAAKLYAKALQQKQMARRLTEFNKVLEEETKKFEPELRENLNIDLMTGVANAIRNFRNESGHPTGQIISREQCFVLLQVVIPCLKKIEALRHHYMLPTPPVTP